MLDRILTGLFLLVILGAGGIYLLTMPQRLNAATLEEVPAGDATKGERLFWAGGCASCHAPAKAKDDDLLKLG
ncbi:MAG: cytochrome C, partial [Aurantimonas coralicida]